MNIQTAIKLINARLYGGQRYFLEGGKIIEKYCGVVNEVTPRELYKTLDAFSKNNIQTTKKNQETQHTDNSKKRMQLRKARADGTFDEVGDAKANPHHCDKYY